MTVMRQAKRYIMMYDIWDRICFRVTRVQPVTPNYLPRVKGMVEDYELDWLNLEPTATDH